MTINTNEIVEKKSLLSLKNRREFEYQSEAERLMLLLCEFNLFVDSYQPFEFKMISARNLSEIESSPGLIIERDSTREFAILSQRLANNSRLADAVKQQLQRNEPQPIKLTIHRPAEIEQNTLAKNLDFLHQFAVLPVSQDECRAIKEYVEFIGEASIKQLKFRIRNEAAIYKLIFFHALRADLENVLISDDMSVNANPLINSIIGSL